MAYKNKAGETYDGGPLPGMSDDDFQQYMKGQGYFPSGGHGSTAPDPKKDRVGPANRGTPNMSKGGEEEVEVSALEKAIVQLASFASDNSPATRREALLEKALHHELDQEETAELAAMLGGEGQASEDGLVKSVGSYLDPSQTTAFQPVDVSEYLGGLHSATQGALGALCEHVEKSDNRNTEFSLLLAKAVVAIGDRVQHLDERLESWSDHTPAEARAVRTPRQAVVKKSFANKPPQGEQLSKSQVMDRMEGMHQKSLKDGRRGKALCGEDINMAIAKYEQTQKVSPAMRDEILAFQ